MDDKPPSGNDAIDLKLEVVIIRVADVDLPGRE
jgi:hypothetical protein